MSSKTKGMQKRAKKGTATGGQWTKGDVPASIAGNKYAKSAYLKTRNATSLRVKAYKTKKKLAAATPGTPAHAALKKQESLESWAAADAKTAAVNARAKAASQGYKISATGKVLSIPKNVAAAQAAVKVKPQIVAKPKVLTPKAAVPKPKPAVQAAPKPPKSGTVTDADIDKTVAAFKTHRKLRLKVLASQKKVKKVAPNTPTHQALSKQIVADVLARNKAKSDFDTLRATINASGTVKFKANADVFKNGVQTHKGGTSLAAKKATPKKPATKKAAPAAKPTTPKAKAAPAAKPAVKGKKSATLAKMKIDAPKKSPDKMTNAEFKQALLDSPVTELLKNELHNTKASGVFKLGKNRAAFVRNLHDKLGFSGTPKVFDKVHNGGGVSAIVYRGLLGSSSKSSKAMFTQFRDGKMFMGMGVYGNGTYTATDISVAHSYSGQNYYNSSTNGTIMKLGIPKTYKTVGYTALHKKTTYASVAHGKSSEKQILRIYKVYPQIAAMALGYDAIKITAKERGGVAQGDYYNIFNRTDLYMEKDPYDG